MKKPFIVFITAVLIVIVGLLVYRANSFKLAIKNAGYDNVFTIVDSNYDDNGDFFRIVLVSNGEEQYDYINIVRNKLGFWSIRYPGNPANAEKKITSISWVRTAGFKRYSLSDNTQFEFETHQYYHGTNAKQLISFHEGQLPSNMTANIQQTGNEYFIHIISFDEPVHINSFDLFNILVQNKMITLN